MPALFLVVPHFLILQKSTRALIKIVRFALCVVEQVVFAVVEAGVLTLHEIRPKDAELMSIFGSPHCGLLKALTMSARSVNDRFSRI